MAPGACDVSVDVADDWEDQSEHDFDDSQPDRAGDWVRSMDGF
jgi:hypothetical protein